MMKPTKLISISLFILVLSGQLFAESVFMKSGTVLEGKIIRETDAAVTLKNSEGIVSRIPRKKIQRVLYHEDYKQAKYIGTKDGRIIHGYIVAENNVAYTVRKHLNRKEELTVKKKSVLYVSARKLVFAENKQEVPPVKNEPRKPYVNPYYNNVRLGARLHYYFGWDYEDDNTPPVKRGYGHTGGFSLFCHWRSLEFELMLAPKYNKESFFIFTASAAWLPVSFYRFRLGIVSGYAQFADNLLYYDYENGYDAGILRYFVFTYGYVIHFSDWLRFSQSFGLVGDAEVKYNPGAVVISHKPNLSPISFSEIQLEIIFLKNYSIQFKFNFAEGNGNSDAQNLQHTVFFASLGIGYRFNL